MLLKVKASVLASINVCQGALKKLHAKPPERHASNNDQQLLQLCLLSTVTFATGAAARFCLVILALLCLPRGTLSVPNRTSNSISSPRNQHAYAWRK